MRTIKAIEWFRFGLCGGLLPGRLPEKIQLRRTASSLTFFPFKRSTL